MAAQMPLLQLDGYQNLLAIGGVEAFTCRGKGAENECSIRVTAAHQLHTHTRARSLSLFLSLPVDMLAQRLPSMEIPSMSPVRALKDT